MDLSTLRLINGNSISHNMTLQRTAIGLSMTFVLLSIIRYQMVSLIALSALVCVFYEAFSLPRIRGMLDFRDKILLAITIAQLGDACQYVVGRRWPYHSIGWISPKKTWEGFIGGFILLYFILPSVWSIFSLYLSMKQQTYGLFRTIVLYVASCLGGLLFSWTKRTIDIKDWSCLLGSH